MESKNLLSKIEALLFIYGEPMELKKLAKMLSVSDSDTKEGLRLLEEELVRAERGLALIRSGNKVQLATKPEFAKILEDITKQEFNEALTPAALETLSIVSYAGPISRADLEYIRGVNSSFTLRALLMRGLVERSVDPKRGNAYLYSPSFELLRHLGLDKVELLPDYEKYKSLVASLHTELKQSQPEAPKPPESTELTEKEPADLEEGGDLTQ